MKGLGQLTIAELTEQYYKVYDEYMDSINKMLSLQAESRHVRYVPEIDFTIAKTHLTNRREELDNIVFEIEKRGVFIAKKRYTQILKYE